MLDARLNLLALDDRFGQEPLDAQVAAVCRALDLDTAHRPPLARPARSAPRRGRGAAGRAGLARLRLARHGRRSRLTGEFIILLIKNA